MLPELDGALLRGSSMSRRREEAERVGGAVAKRDVLA